MELDQDQLEQFDTEGWVFLPDVFSQAEMDVLSGELPGIFAMDRDEVWREANGEAVRTAFAAHYYNEAFRRLGRHPRLIGPEAAARRRRLHASVQDKREGSVRRRCLAVAPGLRHLGS